jgi:hypothetical protein
MAVEWAVESLRLSLFSTDVIPISDRDWEAITTQPEAETRQSVPGGKSYVGNFADGQLTLTTISDRIIIVLASILKEPRNQELPSVGTWEQVRETFVKNTCGWLTNLRNPIIRIGFGAVLLRRTDSRGDAYRELKSLLKSVNVDPDRMRDLLFRTNWPKQSATVDGLSLNRLTTWAALQYTIAVNFIGSAPSVPTRISQMYALRLEIDHNTDEERKTPFEQKDLIPIYQELVELARENASVGEQP